MRLFVTLVSLAALAYAKPQGYNYGTGISGSLGAASGSSFLSAPSGGSYSSSTKYSSGGYSSGGIGGGIGSGIGGFGGLGGGFGSGSSGFSSGSSGYSSSGSSGFGIGSGGFGSGGSVGGGFEAPLVHKQFITVSAPEDHESLEMSKHLVIGRPQKNYRVVFIKAPSSSAANVKLSAEYAPKEEKTVIYVLTKKDNALEVNDIATPEPTIPSKPEVFFIKYKTEQEAQHAQRQIQSEYDKIEGTSEHTDAGVAPQQSVVGILGGGGAGGSIGGGSIGSGFHSSSSTFHASGSGTKGSTYLPPAKVV